MNTPDRASGLKDEEEEEIGPHSFFMSISKIEKILGEIEGDNVTWRFYWGDDWIDVPNNHFTPGYFEDVYFAKFDTLPPSKLGNKKTWRKFKESVGQCAERVEPDLESTGIFEAYQLLDIILNDFQKAEPTPDGSISAKQAWARHPQTFFEYVDQDGSRYYVIEAERVRSLIQEKNLRTSVSRIQEILVEKGFRLKSHHRLRQSKNKQPRCWWFIADMIDDLMNGGEEDE